MRLKKSLIIVLICFTTIPIVIMTIFNFVLTINGFSDYTSEAAMMMAYRNGMALEELVNSQKREVEVMSARKAYLNELMYRKAGNVGEDYRRNRVEAIKMLVDWVDTVSKFTNAWLLDDKGNVIISYDVNDLGKNILDDENYKDTIENGRLVVSDVDEISPNKKYLMQKISAPVRDADGKIIGALMLFLSMDFFHEFIDTIQFDKTGGAFLVDGNNRVIYHDEKKYIGREMDELEKSNIVMHNDERLGGRLKTYVYNMDSKMVSICEYELKSVDWVLAIRQDYGEIMSSTVTAICVAFASIVVWVVLSVICSGFLAQYFMRPAKKFKEIFETSAREKKYIPADLHEQNEIGELVESYNTMIANLSMGYDELEASYKSIRNKEEALRESYGQLHQRERENIALAYLDSVTGLGNKAAFERRMEELLEKGAVGGIILLRLDGLRQINDTLGRGMGNEILRKIGEVISGASPIDVELCTRASGDEFLIIILGYQREIEIFCRHISESLESPFTMNGSVVYASMNMGISMFPKDGDSTQKLIEHVEMATTRARDLGKSAFCFFDDSMRYKLHRQEQVIEILHKSIENNELFLVYLPELDIATNKIVALEALMRIKNKRLGFIAPAEFLPIAEANGLILKMGYWVLEEACNFCKSLIDKFEYSGVVSVNVSATQILEQNFAAMIAKILHSSGLPPERLRLEIAEEVVSPHLISDVKKLNQLRDMGISLALDNFGRVHSSLNSIAYLPLDTVKIDNAFICDLFVDKRKQSIIQYTIEMAHSQGLRVVASGAEFREQHEFLEKLGCDGIQGFLYSVPIECSAVEKLLEKNEA